MTENEKNTNKMLKDLIVINLLQTKAKKADVRKFVADNYGSCDNNYLTELYQLVNGKNKNNKKKGKQK